MSEKTMYICICQDCMNNGDSLKAIYFTRKPLKCPHCGSENYVHDEIPEHQKGKLIDGVIVPTDEQLDEIFKDRK
ncbi:MAG: hypothetical protein ACOCQD_00170 [archaeon]